MAGAGRLLAVVPSALYSSAEVASYFGIKTQTLEGWRRKGLHPELRFRRVGRRIRYLGADVLAFLDAQPKRKRVAR
jgi:hypothetical protein